MREVLRAYDFYDSGQCAEYWGADPPWWLVEGVAHYHRVLERCRSEVLRAEIEERERARRGPKAPGMGGGQVVHRSRG